MSPKAPTKRQREVMQKHRLAPNHFRQKDVMKALKLGRDYHAFYRLFYRCTVKDSTEDFE